jgi:hypothetical protein
MLLQVMRVTVAEHEHASERRGYRQKEKKPFRLGERAGNNLNWIPFLDQTKELRRP